MKYYEHHLGDYLRDTMHLSILEDGAYRRLIDAYYNREEPIPKSPAIIYRSVRAESKAEKDAVNAVLKEFFVSTNDGWRHERCDQELARYQDKRNKAKGSAFARWNAERTEKERNANAMRAHSEGICESDALQSPISNLQSPIKEKESEDKNVLRETERRTEIASFAVSGLKRVPRG